MYSNRFCLTYDKFAKLQVNFSSGARGKLRADDRCVSSGIIDIVKSSCVWVDALSSCGPCKKLYHRFFRWSGTKVTTMHFQCLAERWRSAAPSRQWNLRHAPDCNR